MRSLGRGLTPLGSEPRGPDPPWLGAPSTRYRESHGNRAGGGGGRLPQPRGAGRPGRRGARVRDERRLGELGGRRVAGRERGNPVVRDGGAGRRGRGGGR